MLGASTTLHSYAQRWCTKHCSLKSYQEDVQIIEIAQKELAETQL